MKTLSIFSRKALLLAVAAVTFALPGRAQLIQNTYLNVDWQVTVPLGSAFADKASGWGMNFEGGYFVTPEITVGAFISYQTNIESISRQTLQLGSGAAMTTAQKHTLFELPFDDTISLKGAYSSPTPVCVSAPTMPKCPPITTRSSNIRTRGASISRPKSA